jgi:hypothetical protein
LQAEPGTDHYFSEPGTDQGQTTIFGPNPIDAARAAFCIQKSPLEQSTIRICVDYRFQQAIERLANEVRERVALYDTHFAQYHNSHFIRFVLCRSLDRDGAVKYAIGYRQTHLETG